MTGKNPQFKISDPLLLLVYTEKDRGRDQGYIIYSAKIQGEGSGLAKPSDAKMNLVDY